MIFMLTNFIFVAIILGVPIGGLFGCMFTSGCKKIWTKVVGIIATMIIMGCLFSGGIMLELKADETTWNNGVCPNDNTEWAFSNADHQRNSGTIYYYHCPTCNKVIETHSNFTD